MNVFWYPVILPMLNWLRPKTIVEVGALRGDNTIRLLRYCVAAQARLFCIDPAPAFDVAAFGTMFRGHFRMMQSLSLHVLYLIRDSDFVLLDGDHNWYTVYHELKTIERSAARRGAFPAVLLHDIEWPYGRRDMYYFPETIPAAFRHPYDWKGVVPGQSELAAEGGFNAGLAHAVHEGGPRNGVLTAVEDFLKETSFDLLFYRVVPHHGLGILVPNLPGYEPALRKILAASGLEFRRG